VLAVSTMGAFMASIPARRQQIGQIAAESQAEMESLGASPDFLVGYVQYLDSIVFMSVFAIALVIFIRSSADRLPWLVSLMLVIFGLAVTRPTDALAALPPLQYYLVNFLRYLAYVLGLLFCYLFPDGSFVPRWTRVLAVIWAGLNLAWLFFSRLDYMNSSGIGLLATLLIRANRHDQRLLAYGLSDHYQQIFELTRLNEAIGIYAGAAEALAAAMNGRPLPGCRRGPARSPRTACAGD